MPIKKKKMEFSRTTISLFAFNNRRRKRMNSSYPFNVEKLAENSH